MPMTIQTPLTLRERKDRVIMKITGALVNMLIKINPDLYAGYVVYEMIEQVLYVNVLKSIYGIIDSIKIILFEENKFLAINTIRQEINFQGLFFS